LLPCDSARNSGQNGPCPVSGCFTSASLRGLSLVCVFVCFFDCLFGCLFGKSVKKGPGEQGRQGKVGEPGR